MADKTCQKIEIGMATDPGQKRKGENQDAVGYCKPNWLLRRPILMVVADGMGGYLGGKQASSLVVKQLIAYYRSARLNRSYLEILEDGIEKAHASMVKAAQKQPNIAKMGSTVVAAVLDWPHISIINVGDSRAYLYREGKLTILSQDQSRVAEMAASGLISLNEAAGHPQRSVLTMAISARRQVVRPNINQIVAQPGDQILLCSDGLWSVVPENEIGYFLENFPPQIAAEDLVKQANAYGGPDNISVLIACCGAKGFLGV